MTASCRFNDATIHMTLCKNSGEARAWRFAWLLLMLFSFGCADTPAPGVGVEVGLLAPDFQVKNLRGGTATLSAYRGKVVLMNFWATWCGPCKAEMPSMEALYREYREAGLEILAISIDTSGAPPVRAYIEEFGFSFPVLLDSDYRINDLYRVRVVPTSLIIDRDGVVVRRLLGATDWNRPDERKRMERIMRPGKEKVEQRVGEMSRPVARPVVGSLPF
jgi:peroxiredoxin